MRTGNHGISGPMAMICRLMKKNLKKNIIERRSLSSKFTIIFQEFKSEKTWKSVFQPYGPKSCFGSLEVEVLLYKNIEIVVLNFLPFFPDELFGHQPQFSTLAFFGFRGLWHRIYRGCGNKNGTKKHIGHPFEMSVTNIVANLPIFSFASS